MGHERSPPGGRTSMMCDRWAKRILTDANPLPKAITILVLAALFGCSRGMPHEGKSVAQLEKMLRDENPQKQAQAAYGLSLAGPEARSATALLAERLKSPDSI